MVNHKTSVNLTFTIVLVSLLFLVTCDQTGKRVSIRFKFQPGLTLTYEQVTSGLIQVHDRTSGKLFKDEFAKTTMDIEYYVRQILEDSTAEIVESKKWRSRSDSRLDSNRSDSVIERMKQSPQIIKYLKPSGKLVDAEYVSDTARRNLEYLKEYYKQGFPEFPAGDIGQGHSWSQTTTVVLPDGPVEASTTYTVKSFARERGYDCVVIEYEGISIIPLSAYSSEKEDLVAGVDNIVSKGHLYFAYKEGVMVLARERWVLDSDRTVIKNEADTVNGYEAGDTVLINIGIEYDVDYYLTGMEIK